MENKVIQVKVFNVYGNETIYPICESAMLFAKLLRQKSLTRSNIEIIKALGYKVEVVQDRQVL